MNAPEGLADLTREQLLAAVNGDNGEAEQRLRESIELMRARALAAPLRPSLTVGITPHNASCSAEEAWGEVARLRAEWDSLMRFAQAEAERAKTAETKVAAAEALVAKWRRYGNDRTYLSETADELMGELQ